MPYDTNNNPYYVAKIPDLKRVTDDILVLCTDYKYKDLYGIERTIARGFINDGASRPKLLEFFIQKDSLNNSKFMEHDYNYWHQFCTRAEADRLLLIGLLRNPNNPVGWCYTVYYNLRLFGWKSWNDNTKIKKAMGLRNRYMAEADIVEIEARIKIDDE